MDIGILLQSIGGLFVILVILLFVFILPARKKKKQKEAQAKKEKKEKKAQEKKNKEIPSFDELRARVRRKSTSTQELEETIDLVIKYYSKIPKKLGIRPHPDFDKYVDLIVHLVRHKNTNKNIILKLDKALLEKNPEYKPELNDALTKALNSRVILHIDS